MRSFYQKTAALMKRITFRVDESLIQEARLVAKAQHTTLTAVFREWLSRFASQRTDPKDFDRIMTRLRHVKSGRSFTRDETNQR